MANQITGRLVQIGQLVQIPSKSGGQAVTKREFLLDATTHDPYTGERSEYENIVPLEVIGEKCDELNKFKVGDVITVSFALQGRSWTNQTGEQKRMVSVRCYRIEAKKPKHEQQAQQPQPQQPQPQRPAQQPVQQQQGWQPQQPPQWQAPFPTNDDVPFTPHRRGQGSTS